MRNYADLFEDSREKLLDALADAVQNIHRHKEKIEGLEGKPPAAPAAGPPKEDFLYDFLRLNVQYMNQLARLGSSYSVVASRALERLYSWVTPDDEKGVKKGP